MVGRGFKVNINDFNWGNYVTLLNMNDDIDGMGYDFQISLLKNVAFMPKLFNDDGSLVFDNHADVEVVENNEVCFSGVIQRIEEMEYEINLTCISYEADLNNTEVNLVFNKASCINVARKLASQGNKSIEDIPVEFSSYEITEMFLDEKLGESLKKVALYVGERTGKRYNIFSFKDKIYIRETFDVLNNINSKFPLYTDGTNPPINVDSIHSVVDDKSKTSSIERLKNYISITYDRGDNIPVPIAEILDQESIDKYGLKVEYTSLPNDEINENKFAPAHQIALDKLRELAYPIKEETLTFFGSLKIKAGMTVSLGQGLPFREVANVNHSLSDGIHQVTCTFRR